MCIPDFLFALLHEEPLSVGSTFREKIILLDKQIISFRVDPIKKGDNLENGRVPFLQVYPFALISYFAVIVVRDRNTSVIQRSKERLVIQSTHDILNSDITNLCLKVNFQETENSL